MVQIEVAGDQLKSVFTQLSGLKFDTTPVMQAIGTTLKSITEGNFNSVGASYRPAPWAAKKSGGASNLQKSTTMAKSFHLTYGPRIAVISNPTVYGPIHQFGLEGDEPVPEHTRRITVAFGRKLKQPTTVTVRAHTRRMHMPARPFLPITPAGQLTPAADLLASRAGERALNRLLGNAET